MNPLDASDTTAPPTEAGDMLPPAEVPRWPPVVGGISIGWSVLLLGCAGCSMGASYWFASMMKVPVLAPSPVLLLFTFVGVALNALLFAGGMATVLRRPAGRPIHLIWAVASLLLLPVGIYLQMQQQVRIEEWVQNNPDSDFSKAAAAGQNKLGEVIGLAFGVLLGVSYPLFCMIWFGAVKRTPASMTGGVRTPTLGSI